MDAKSLFRSMLSFLFPKKQFPTLPYDGIAWEVHPVPDRSVVVGDVQGDFEALVTILVGAGLIDDDGKWAGRDSHLILMGDLIGGHKYSRLVLNLIIRLEGEAKRSGGAVHAILGNHDILPVQGKTEKLLKAEKELYKKFEVRGARSQKMRSIFGGESEYGVWTSKRNTLLKVGEYLFVHAGLEEWALESDPGRVNTTVRAWIKYWQGVGEKPPKETGWVVGRGREIGPLWQRSFKVKSSRGAFKHKSTGEAPHKELVEKVLSRYRARAVVLGHAPVDTSEILLSHPTYGDRVILVDTRLSDSTRGRLSALEIKGARCIPYYFKREKKTEKIFELEWARLTTRKDDEGLLKRLLRILTKS